MRQLEEKGLQYDPDEARLELLGEEHEKAIMDQLARYPEVVNSAASGLEPHLLANFLRELATRFHIYYNAHQFLVDDGALRAARLNLIRAVRQVIDNGLDILGVSAPESM